MIELRPPIPAEAFEPEELYATNPDNTLAARIRHIILTDPEIQRLLKGDDGGK